MILNDNVLQHTRTHAQTNTAIYIPKSIFNFSALHADIRAACGPVAANQGDFSIREREQAQFSTQDHDRP